MSARKYVYASVNMGPDGAPVKRAGRKLSWLRLLSRWAFPLVSPVSAMAMFAAVFVGMIGVQIEDMVGEKILTAEYLSFVELMLSVIMGLYLQTVYTAYQAAQTTIASIVRNCNSKTCTRETIQGLLAAPSLADQAEFTDCTGSAVDYKRFTELYACAHSPHDPVLSATIFWTLMFYSAVCVPVAFNDAADSSDYRWLAPTLVRMIVGWAMYDLILLYSNISGNAVVWIYDRR
jgi:hypothetical protein